MHHVPIEDSIDLHMFPPRDIPSVVEEYIHAATEAGFREVRIIHGRGKGVQRAIVQELLDRLDAVEEFWDDTRSSLGATMVKLREFEKQKARD